ncbi:MAG: two-component regulator propeller domain-containing protein, partial [Acidobacteriota bacterium]
MTGRLSASWMLAAAWLCLGLALPAELRADPLADDRFIQLGPRPGLDVRVLDIVQDRQGFLWFSTVRGLRRYDGSQIRTYRHDPDDPSSLSDDHTRELLIDARGTLWISTANGRLDRWLPEEERFQRSSVDLGGIPADVLEISPGRLLLPLTG